MILHCEGYSRGCTIVGLQGMDAAIPEKDENMDNAKVDRLCDLLENFLNRSGASEAEDEQCDCDMPGGKHTRDCACHGDAVDEIVPISHLGGEGNVNPLPAKDARAALQNLRNLRGFIEANGDRKAKDAYNSAVKAVKNQIALGEGFNPRTSAYDSRSLRRSEAADFEASAARFHGKAIKVHGDVNAPDDDHRAEDAAPVEESFDDAVARARNEQQARYMPKKR
jgi:hypothetical protein